LIFGASTFGAKPFSGALVIAAAGQLLAAVDLAGTGAARVSSTGLLAEEAVVQSHLVAMRSASGAVVNATVFEGRVSIVSNAMGLAVQSVPLLGVGAGVVSSEAYLEASASLLGYRLRAYDQLFPANVANGDKVQIGSRLYEWLANTGRWRPSGPAPWHAEASEAVGLITYRCGEPSE
jgi:hypothetical protein